MPARSRSARGIMLTRNAMLRLELGKKFPSGSSLPAARFFEPLADALVHIGLRGDVQQALIGLGVLHDCLSLALDREHHGALALLELLHEIAGATTEAR